MNKHRGRAPNPFRETYQNKFTLSEAMARKLRVRELEQLELCSDDMARRILLGITRSYENEEQG